MVNAPAVVSDSIIGVVCLGESVREKDVWVCVGYEDARDADPRSLATCATPY